MEQKQVKALFAWAKAGHDTAVRIAEQYRRAGMEYATSSSSFSRSITIFPMSLLWTSLSPLPVSVFSMSSTSVSICFAEPEGLAESAAARKMTHVLYFLDEERLTLISLADEMGGFTAEVFVSELFDIRSLSGAVSPLFSRSAFFPVRQ